ncbi:MAG: hypothetical protein M0Z94_20800 [Dehalococcoidales bacterium]|nr:hypothetical protein [Dehalococcoidales bacterium]
MTKPFEVGLEYLTDHLEEMVNEVFADLQSQFLVLPKGNNFVEYANFEEAYEVLKRHTSAFTALTESKVRAALREDSLALIVLRSILGMSPPEWAELARSEGASDVDTGAARNLEAQCRKRPTYLAQLFSRGNGKTLERVNALVSVAVKYIVRGAPARSSETVHRLDKADTVHGLKSVEYVASQRVPYAMLLYERYLGRPFATHRDAVSELVGEIMENTIAKRLDEFEISYYRTQRGRAIPGYAQAADFYVPDEYRPEVQIEAKMASDDGTARDKVARILRLAQMRDERIRRGESGFELIACIDGRGFGVRREDMRSILLAFAGKVFTLETLDQLIEQTSLKSFVTAKPSLRE